MNSHVALKCVVMFFACKRLYGQTLTWDWTSASHTANKLAISWLNNLHCASDRIEMSPEAACRQTCHCVIRHSRERLEPRRGWSTKAICFPLNGLRESKYGTSFSAGDKASFKVKVTGNPKPIVTWKRESGKPLTEGVMTYYDNINKLYVLKVSTLRIWCFEIELEV